MKTRKPSAVSSHPSAQTTDPMADVPKQIRAYGIDAVSVWREWRQILLNVGLTDAAACDMATDHIKLTYSPHRQMITAPGLLLAFLCILSVPPCLRGDPIDSWLTRTAWLESRHKPQAIGDQGRSRGAYQIKQPTWQRYSRRPWRSAAHDAVESRRVARQILIDCVRACRRDRRPVTFQNVRWYYRRGGF